MVAIRYMFARKLGEIELALTLGFLIPMSIRNYSSTMRVIVVCLRRAIYLALRTLLR